MEHDPAARALVLEGLRERCLKVWPQLGEGALCIVSFKPQTHQHWMPRRLRRKSQQNKTKSVDHGTRGPSLRRNSRRCVNIETNFCAFSTWNPRQNAVTECHRACSRWRSRKPAVARRPRKPSWMSSSTFTFAELLRRVGRAGFATGQTFFGRHIRLPHRLLEDDDLDPHLVHRTQRTKCVERACAWLPHEGASRDRHIAQQTEETAETDPTRRPRVHSSKTRWRSKMLVVPVFACSATNAYLGEMRRSECNRTQVRLTRKPPDWKRSGSGFQ